MKKIKYIPIIDQLFFFFFSRAKQYSKRIILINNPKIHSTVRIGDFCKFDNNIIIGEGTYLGDLCQLYAGKNSKVEIGKFCAIGHNVHIKARTHDLSRPTPSSQYRNKRKEKSVFIEDNVWIGDNVFIKEGITIKQHAIIAANSVVIKDVQEKEIVGGVPAKHIRFNHLLK